MTSWPAVDAAPSRRAGTSAAVRPLTRRPVLRRLDWVLLATAGSLSLLGAALVWSATRSYNAAHGLDPQAFLKKDVLNIGIGVVLGAATALIDHRTLRAYAPFVYLASCLGLMAVLSPLGTTINGAHSWIPLPGGFELQPAEFAKVALVVGMAMLLAEKRDARAGPRAADIALALALAAVPLGLIMLQPDFGTTMVLVFVILGVLAMSGVSGKWIAALLALGLVAAALIVGLHLLKPYQIQRFTAFTSPTSHTNGFGYQTAQARIAIGSGGVWGRGLFHGPQTNGHFVPEQQTDFVFTVAGEELGFLGAGGIILLSGLVLWRGLRIAARAEDMFGTLLACGIVCWFAIQAFENIGMAMGIMPMTGIPLPFVSYGGSSMFACWIAVGLLQNIRLRSREA